MGPIVYPQYAIAGNFTLTLTPNSSTTALTTALTTTPSTTPPDTASDTASDTPPATPPATPSATPSTPWCEYGSDPNGDQIPQDYCQCGDNYGSMYSVASSTTSPYNPCPYTTPPGPTIVFSTASPTIPSPSPSLNCSMPNGDEINYNTASSDAQDFCQKNEGQNLAQGTEWTPGLISLTYPNTGISGKEGLGSVITISAMLDPACQNQSPRLTINQSDCNAAIADIINHCITSLYLFIPVV